MSRLVFLAMLVCAALAAQKCWDIPADNRFKKLTECVDRPAKACGSGVDGATAPDFRNDKKFDDILIVIDNETKYNWEMEGYRECQASAHLCKEKTFTQRYDDAKAVCGGYCDSELKDTCIKFLLDNWNGYCSNANPGSWREEGCKKDSKYYSTQAPYCELLAASVKNGGATCENDAECNLLQCYDEYCHDWCRHAKHCWDKVELKLLAPKDSKDCKKAYFAPWNAASTVVPSLLALVAVLLAL